MSEDLKRRCSRLTTEEKIQLVAFLSSSIQREREFGKSSIRGSILLGEMGKIYGRVISLTNRDAGDVWARTMVVYQMILEGYSITEIGRQLLKDHSTIIHLRKKMEDALSLPQAYQDILPIWEQFKQRLDNDIHQGSDGSPLQV